MAAAPFSGSDTAGIPLARKTLPSDSSFLPGLALALLAASAALRSAIITSLAALTDAMPKGVSGSALASFGAGLSARMGPVQPVVTRAHRLRRTGMGGASSGIRASGGAGGSGGRSEAGSALAGLAGAAGAAGLRL